MASRARTFRIASDEDGRLAALLSGKRRVTDEQRVVDGHRALPEIAAPPDTPALNSYDAETRVIGGSAEAGSTVTLFDEGVEVDTAVADADGDWSIALGDIAEGNHFYSATATNADGESAASPEIRIIQNSDGSVFVQGLGGVDYRFTGTDFDDSFNIDVDGGQADVMAGGAGDDRYFVSSGFDLVVENSGEGEDRVTTAISYTLGNAIENLTGVATSGGQSLTGNDGDNLIVASDAGATLDGREGDDSLFGDDGADTLEGGEDNDTLEGGDNPEGAPDIAIYNGDRDEYAADTISGGFRIDHIEVLDGVDSVFEVEIFRFADGDVLAEDLVEEDPSGEFEAVDDSAATDEDRVVFIDALANDNNVEVGDSAADDYDEAFVASDPEDGVVYSDFSFEDGYTFAYLPNPGFVGTDSFAYTIEDEETGATSTATVTVTVTEAIEDPATPQPLDSEMLVNSDTGIRPEISTTAALDGGGHVVVWTTQINGGPLFGQRYDADGVPVGANFRIDDAASDGGNTPGVTALPGGGCAVVWASSYPSEERPGSFDEEVLGKVYAADGSVARGVFRINSENVHDIGTPGESDSPSISTLADGGFVVAWVGGDFLGETSDANLYTRRFDAAGDAIDAADVAVTEAGPTTTTFRGSTVAGLADGGHVVAWVFDEDEDVRTDNVLLARAYGADGAPLGGAFEINPDTTISPRDTDIAAFDGGGFVLIWTDGDDVEGPSGSTFAQKFDAGLAPVGPQALVNTQTYFGQNAPTVAARPDGGFVVAWQTSRQDAFVSDGIYAQAFDAGSNRAGDEFRVSETRFGNQFQPDVAVLENGDPVFVWSGFGRGDELGVQTRRFSFEEQANEAPVAPDDTITFREDQPIPLNFLANDSDADGDPLTTTLIFDIDTPDFGLLRAGVSQQSNGTAFFTPPIDFTGEISFAYEISDGRGGTDTARVTVIVTEANDPEPFAGEQIANPVTDGNQGAPAIAALDDGGFLLVWTDSDSGAIVGRRFEADGEPIDADAFQIGEGAGASLTALDDGGFVVTWTGTEDGSGQDVHTRRLDADGNPTGDELVVTATGDQAGASAAALGGGDYVLVWGSRDAGGNSEGFFGRIVGEDGLSVDFTVDDQAGFGGGTAVAALPGGGFIVAYSISVPGPDPETTVDDGSMVVARRFGADGQPTDAEPFVLGTSDRTGETGAGGGAPAEVAPSITAVGDGFVVTWGDVRFGFNGAEGGRIDGRMLDGSGAPLGEEIQINSNMPGDLLQSSHAVTPLEDGGFLATWRSFNGAFFLGNARSDIIGQVFDANGDRVQTEFLVNESEVALRGGGSGVQLADGSLVFSWSASPGQNETSDIFFRRFEAPEASANTAPVAADDAATTDEDEAVAIAVLANDSDIDGDALVVIATTMPANGAVAVNADGTISYTPDTDFSGTDGFTYTISDGNGGSDTGSVTVTVNEVVDPPGNTAPVASDDSATTSEDDAVTITVLANDSDADGDALTVTAATAPANGDVTVNADGTVTYTPDADFSGEDSFSYTISDGNGGSDSANVSVIVEDEVDPPVNTPPVASDDAASTEADEQVVIAVLANDSDAEGDALTVTAATAPANGSVVINADGTITYTPDGDSIGPDSFGYTVSDGNGGSDGATVTVDVAEDVCGVTLSGGASDDVLTGSRCEDMLTGGDGDDLLVALPGRDTLDGGGGDDTLEGDGGRDTLTGAAGADTLAGGGSADLLQGDVGEDRLIGSQGRDTILGGEGNDRLDGGLDKDELIGGAGDDTLVADEGRDTLTGGAGGDRFRFDAPEDFSGEEQFADRIADFSQAEGDEIDLRKLDAIAGGEDDSFAVIGGAAFSGVAGELRFEQVSNALTYVEGDVDGDGAADFTIRLETLVDLTATDFLL